MGNLAKSDKPVDRLKAVILLGLGWPLSQVTQVLLIDRTMVHRNYRNYQKTGVALLASTNFPPPSGYFSGFL